MARLRVVVAEDHDGMRALIVRLLSAEFEVVGAVGDGQSLVASAASLKPDVIVSDIHMPSRTGPQAMQDLSSLGYEIPFVFVSLDFEFMTQGQASFVSKLNLRTELVLAVCMAASGRVYVPLRFDAHPKPGQR